MDQELVFAIPTLFGLEGVVVNELRKLGLSSVRGETGRVFCRGTAEQIPRLNLNLRTGERVLVVLGSFPAKDPDALFEGTKALGWEEMIPQDGAFPVKGYSLKSQLRSVPACQKLIKKAVATRLGQVYGRQTLPETGARYPIQFALMEDRVTLMLDTSGEGLHKRGYRARGAAAPLRETLAAGMVLLSQYRGRDPLCDPFCGSGTILIEAAMIARNQAPGLQRTFLSQKWGWVPPSLWYQAGEEAMDREFHGKYELWGGDLDGKVLEQAKENAQLAQVDPYIRFEVQDGRQFRPSGPYGRIITNPPYGERLLDHQEAQNLYHQFGQAIRPLPQGWRLYLLSSHTEFERAFGETAGKKRKLYHGMLKCDLFMYGMK